MKRRRRGTCRGDERVGEPLKDSFLCICFFCVYKLTIREEETQAQDTKRLISRQTHKDTDYSYGQRAGGVARARGGERDETRRDGIQQKRKRLGVCLDA